MREKVTQSFLLYQSFVPHILYFPYSYQVLLYIFDIKMSTEAKINREVKTQTRKLAAEVTKSRNAQMKERLALQASCLHPKKSLVLYGKVKYYQCETCGKVCVDP